ncbi:acetolactate synthase AlsS [Spiroplasma eriocheiris]|uniref:Acetolactate synthase n=1 Tax=Spiroplasma eriocheiris TaxID=315358 RepID=A0A0H3XJJ2_9MOLU|nr:acetolactate synthase AlsS [Spiroplasma eriocheiris]AHF58325.1 acetolactate synthase [Spiroplasma eriocheiris CCTCC M 207170]AKM54760.1 acetolactate synthase [Spiroplasma eriocheiris]
MENKKITGADIVVDTLINQNVEYIFGIPGAKIDKVFDVLLDRGPKLILTRHEQNAAFIAGGIGRITGKPGVVLVTSGPGASNLATGLVTANAEGDPIVAIAGNVSRADSLKRTHQSMDNAALFAPITKYSKEVVHPDNISEALVNAFREATSPRKGATFVSLPQDIVNATDLKETAILPFNKHDLGPAEESKIDQLIVEIKKAKLPVLLLGMRSSSREVTTVIRKLLTKTKIPVVETFQAAGVISRELETCFYGRVGLFKNQPGDILLDQSDLVIAVGYDPIEYDPVVWNHDKKSKIIHIDEVIADIDNYYQPELELIGDLPATLNKFIDKFEGLTLNPTEDKILNDLHTRLMASQNVKSTSDSNLTHPLHIINTLRALIDDKVTVAVDVGSIYIWMARHFRSYEPRRLLFSNGMQTLGVALPWGIAACLVRPGEKVVSMSGDGGFLFSAMELETAVRLNLPLVHLIWNDGYFDMVAFQQNMKYNRTSAVELGPVDFVKYAESFGAIGLRVNHPSELQSVLEQALAANKPVIVDIPVDYKDNILLAKTLLDKEIY